MSTQRRVPPQRAERLEPLHPDKTSLGEAKAWLRARFSEGAPCPCCNQLVKRYKRPFNSSMARALIEIYHYFQKAHHGPWLHVPSYLRERADVVDVTVSGGDWSKARYWGLIQEKPIVREDGSNRAGYYSITDLGKKFVRGEAQIPSHVYIYNDQPLGFPEGRTISIREALGKKFSYTELMRQS